MRASSARVMGPSLSSAARACPSPTTTGKALPKRAPASPEAVRAFVRKRAEEFLGVGSEEHVSSSLRRLVRAQTRALERIRAERSALEKTQREIAAMTEKNAENERALASFAKWSAGAMRENASSMEEIERVTTEMTDRLGAVSEQHVRDAYEAEARAAEAMNASRAAAVFANLDEVKGKS